jgi:hypothetical protein
MNNRIEYNFINKSHWREGPWFNEPDKIQWIDETTGYDCLIVRNKRFGFLCGYCGIDFFHPFYQKHYDKIGNYESIEIDVHGDLTFSDFCSGEEETGICHIPLNGRSSHIWWFGFDCGHAYDIFPHPLFDSDIDDLTLNITYKTIPYVESQVQHLAKQLFEIENQKRLCWLRN